MNYEQIINRIQTLAREQGRPQWAVFKDAGLQSSGPFRNWRNGSKPNLATIEAIAKALGCSVEWLLEAPEIKVWRGDRVLRAEDLPLDAPTGTGIEVCAASWEHEDLFRYLDILGFWERTMLLEHHEDSFIYRHIGNFFGRTLGYGWAMSSIGTKLGENDPDQDFANWCLETYSSVLENNEPRRQFCQAVSSYTGEDLFWEYDRLCFPLTWNDKQCVIMIAAVIN